MNALLVLEDGYSFPCKSFTGSGEAGGEIVFNTSMTGYQEILTDPSYCNQMIMMTYPLIGSCGVNFEDMESSFIHATAFFIKEYQLYTSNFRSKSTLVDFLKYYKIIGLENLDTRALTRYIREFGSMRGFVSTYNLNSNYLSLKAKALPEIEGLNLVNQVTTHKAYKFTKKGIKIFKDNMFLDQRIWDFRYKKPSVVVFDYGLKRSIIQSLLLYDFEIIVVPAYTDAWVVKKMAPDGIILSNGPGNPSLSDYAIENVKKLINIELPIFGVCLGHQILGIALGAKTYKLKFGHRGSNHPVKNLITGKIEITAQNHGFAISIDSIRNCEVYVTHTNLNDNTVEGIQHKKLPFFSVQYHPESSPGPKDSHYLFEYFETIIKSI